jgi:hypothetical protein
MKKGFVILGVLILSASSCEKLQNGCKETKNASSLIVSFPDSIKVAETFYLDVRYVLDNTCGEFETFEINSDQGTIDVSIVTKYEGCKCEQQLIERTSTYPIHISVPGIYHYRFWLSGEDWDEYTLKVYQ